LAGATLAAGALVAVALADAGFAFPAAALLANGLLALAFPARAFAGVLDAAAFAGLAAGFTAGLALETGFAGLFRGDGAMGRSAPACRRGNPEQPPPPHHGERGGFSVPIL
jgi:hypothetical protein